MIRLTAQEATNHKQRDETVTTYTTEFCGDKYEITANFSLAGDPIVCNGETTQYQVADFSHDSDAAMRRILEECVDAGGDDIEDFRDDIEAAISGTKATDDDK